MLRAARVVAGGWREGAEAATSGARTGAAAAVEVGASRNSRCSLTQ